MAPASSSTRPMRPSGTPATHWPRSSSGRRPLRLGEPLDHDGQALGVDESGQDVVDRHPRRQLARQGLGPGCHRGAHGVGDPESGERLADRGGEHVDDPAPARCHHARHQELRQQVAGVEVAAEPASKSSSPTSIRAPGKGPPELLTRMWTGPWVSRSPRTVPARAARSSWSVTTKRAAVAPAARSSSTVAQRVFTERASTVTSAPFAASIRAAARPIPSRTADQGVAPLEAEAIRHSSPAGRPAGSTSRGRSSTGPLPPRVSPFKHLTNPSRVAHSRQWSKRF